MGRKKAAGKKTKVPARGRHRYLKRFLIGLAITALLIIGFVLFAQLGSSVRQSRLQPFYDTAGLPVSGPPGEIMKKEALGTQVANGQGFRVLYRTQKADGSITFSSGMVFVPDNTNAGLPRPVVAWAHGTLGLGDACAPSRTKNPVGNISWVSTMLQKGWVVTATDYAGFGTPGTQGYLVGEDEAHDVLNSVRAARNIPAARAGTGYVIWGHSQGGNSALFSAHEAAVYAPELSLAGTVASAPAAELIPLLNEQYGTVADWVIGPLITTSWPAANPSLQTSDILTTEGSKTYQRIADHCIARSTVGGLIRNILGQKFFSRNPVDVSSWRAMASKQSAPLPAAGQPLMVVESKTDKVVLPDTTALYIKQACGVDSTISTLWLDKVSHQHIPGASASDVISWIGNRFAGKTFNSDCSNPLPFKPAAVAS